MHQRKILDSREETTERSDQLNLVEQQTIEKLREAIIVLIKQKEAKELREMLIKMEKEMQKERAVKPRPLALREATLAERQKLELEEQQKAEKMREAEKQKKVAERATLVIKLEKKMQEKHKVENAPVHIKEVIAYQDFKNKLGEFDLPGTNNSEPGDDIVERMVKHIKELADKTSQQHLNDNFDNPGNFISNAELSAKAYEQAKKNLPTGPSALDILNSIDLTDKANTMIPEATQKQQEIQTKKEIRQQALAGLEEARYDRIGVNDQVTDDELIDMLTLKILKDKFPIAYVQAELDAKSLLPTEPSRAQISIELDKIKEELKTKAPSAAMKSDKTNEITRLVTHEFSFFPNKDRGPLTTDDFKNLLAQIGKLADQYPENLHLMLGSFPVLIEGTTQVQNMVVFAQCGDNAKLNVFAKAMPSHIDALYPNTTNPSYSHDVASPSQVSEIGSLNWYQDPPNSAKWTNNIKNLLSYSDTIIENHVNINLKGDMTALVREFVKVPDIDIAIKRINEEPFVLRDSMDMPIVIPENENVLFALEKIKDAVNKKSYPNLRIALTELEAALGPFTNYWQIKQKDAINENLSSLALGEKGGAPVYYGGNIICETAGKATFRIGADICLDHQMGKEGVAKQIVKQDFSNVNRLGEGIIPEHGSHVVMSNVINVEPKNVITEKVTHADPMYSTKDDPWNQKAAKGFTHMAVTEVDPNLIKNTTALNPTTTVDIVIPSFGSKTTVDSYASRQLGELTGELGIAMKGHNAFMIQLEALRHSRKQNDYGDCSKEIAERIITYITDNIKDKGDKTKFASLMTIATTDKSPQERCTEIISALEKIDPKLLTTNEAKVAIEVGKGLLKREHADLQPFVDRAENIKIQSLNK